MSYRPIILISVCLAAIAAGLVWFLRSDTVAVSIGNAVTDTAEKLPAPAERAVGTADASVESGTNRRQSAVNEQPVDAELANRRRDMANALYLMSRDRLVEDLTSSGLAESDSEAIARRYASDIAECATTSLAMEAQRQSISVDELFSRLREAMDFGDLNPSDVDPSDVMVRLSYVVDLTSIETNLLPCWVDAMQRAGLPYEAEAQSLLDQFGIENP